MSTAPARAFLTLLAAGVVAGAALPAAPAPSAAADDPPTLSAAASARTLVVAAAGPRASSLSAYTLHGITANLERPLWTRTLDARALSTPIVIPARSAGERAAVLTLASDGILRAMDAASGVDMLALRIAPAAPSPDLTLDEVFVEAPWAPGGAACPWGEARNCQRRTLVAGTTGALVFVVDLTRADAAPGAKGAAACAASSAPAGCSGRYGALVFSAPLDARAAPVFARVRDGNRERAVVVAGSADRAAGRLSLLDAATGAPVREERAGISVELGVPRPRALAPIRARASAVDTDGDGFDDLLLFGDAAGQLWKMRLPPVGDGHPRLLFDGAREADGRSVCAPAAACPPEIAVAFAPACVSEGREPESGRPLFGVSWATGARLYFLFDALTEGGASRSLARGSAGAPDEIPDARAPDMDACGRPPGVRRAGWSLAFGRGEGAASPVTAIANALYLTTASPAGARFFRAYALSGDSCRGAGCCPGAPSWGGAAPRDRGAGLGGPADAASAPFLFADAKGSVHVGVVARANGRLRLVAVDAGGEPRLRDFRQP